MKKEVFLAMQVTVDVQMEFSAWHIELKQNDTFDFYCKKLEEKFEHANLIEIHEVKHRKNGVEFLSIGRITQAHPAFEQYKSKTSNLGENWQDDPLSKLIAETIGIDSNNIENITHLPGKNHRICLIQLKTKWSKLALGELKFAFLYISLKAHLDNTLTRIKHRFFKGELPETMRQWISELQLSLLNEAIDLLNVGRDGIPENANFIKNNYSTQEFKALTLFFLNQAILDIKRKYGHHFSDEVNEYMRHYHLTIGELQTCIQTVKEIISLFNDQDLKNMILEQIEVIESSNAGLVSSLHEYNYAKILMFELTNNIKNLSDINSLGNQISETLLLLNFNHTSFIAWRVKKLRDEMKNLNNQLELRQWLLREHKKIKQQIPLTKIAFRPNFPSASKLLSKWINEELAYMDGIHASNPEETIHVAQNSNNQKLTTYLNVPQLALFAALMAEEGVIENKNKTQVFTTFSNTFRTVNQENIAVTSLRNNYYDKDPKNIEVLKTKLIQMINRLNRNLNSNETF